MEKGKLSYSLILVIQLRPEGSIPSPRRRHCAGFIGSGLVIFGGFDGYFHNDLYYLDVKCYYNVKIPKSTITLDYFRLIDNQVTVYTFQFN